MKHYKMRSAAWRTVFDFAAKKQEILQFEREMLLPGFWDKRERAKEISERLSTLKDEVAIWDKMLEGVASLKELIGSPEGKDLEKEIVEQYEAVVKIFDNEKRMAFLSGKYDKGDAVMSVYAGAGGDDAEDWARILLEMYERYAARRGWSDRIIHRHENERGGVKNVTFEVDGKYAYGYLKGEAGVHRLVRVSPFSAKQLRHTSFALVEVMPKFVEKEEVEMRDEDLEISFARSSGPGGQNVNKRETAVYARHIPTGLYVHVDSERSQAQNKEKALELLRAKLYQKQKEKQTKEKEAVRGEGVEAEWGHQIRSYVFHPYKLVKDHRTEVETRNVDKVLGGDLDEFISAELQLVK